MQHAKLLISAVALLALAAGWFGFYSYEHAFSAETAERSGPEQNGRRVALRPEFDMVDTEGRQRHLREWDGKLLLINFWATWCAPCRDEIPHFIELQQRYADQGVQFIGVALDRPDEVRHFMQEMAFNYPVLVNERAGYQIMKRYGNRIGALPYTVVVDRQGRIVFTRKGELFPAQAEAVIQQHR